MEWVKEEPTTNQYPPQPKSDTDPKIQHLEHIENIKSLFLLVYLRRADGACFAQENTPVKRATAKQNCVKKIQVQQCGY